MFGVGQATMWREGHPGNEVAWVSSGFVHGMSPMGERTVGSGGLGGGLGGLGGGLGGIGGGLGHAGAKKQNFLECLDFILTLRYILPSPSEVR